MITIDKSGLQLAADMLSQVDEMRKQFRNHDFLRLPALFSSPLVEELYLQIAQSQWEPRSHGGIGEEICILDHTIEGLINFLLNDQQLFDLLQNITGCPAIGSFAGRIYRMLPNSGHYDSWHTDFGEHRLLALSMNLSKQVYQGGVLQIRKRNSESAGLEVSNTEFGNAILFRLAADLEHRVTTVEGEKPKTAFAGWFRSEPKYWESFGTP